VILFYAREAATNHPGASEVGFVVPADPDDPDSQPIGMVFHVGLELGQPVFTIFLPGER
jgi:hypothetical protein